MSTPYFLLPSNKQFHLQQIKSMNKLSYVLNGILALAIAGLYYLHFKTNSTLANTASKATLGAMTSNIAYVDVDSMEQHYVFFKEKKEELEKRQKQIEATLETKMQSLQREAYDLQQRAPTLTQSEGEAIQAGLMKKQQDLEQMRDNMSSSFLSEQSEFNKTLNSKLDSFLQDYNKDKKYVYILSYIKGGSILYKDKANDITTEVTAGMNERYTKK